jgi:hypothetical protein
VKFILSICEGIYAYSNFASVASSYFTSSMTEWQVFQSEHSDAEPR